MENACRIIGKQIPDKEIRAILEYLEIEVLREDAGILTLAVPTARVEVTREIAVVEEVLRIYGYDHIEMPTKVNASLFYSGKPDEAAMRHGIAAQIGRASCRERVWQYVWRYGGAV